MKTTIEIKKRLTSESPDLFKKIQWICIVLGTLISGLGGIFMQNFPNFQYGTVMLSIGATILSVGTLLAKLPVKNIDDINETKDETTTN